MQVVLNNIKKRREELDYSQEYMAFKLEISQGAYSKFEAGRSELNLSKFITICRILETDFNGLMKGNPNSDKEDKNVEDRLAYLESELSQLKKIVLQQHITI